MSGILKRRGYMLLPPANRQSDPTRQQRSDRNTDTSSMYAREGHRLCRQLQKCSGLCETDLRAVVGRCLRFHIAARTLLPPSAAAARWVPEQALRTLCEGETPIA